MIKLIKSLCKKLFSKKEEVIVKLDHCPAHSRFKKSCPACKMIAYA
jgi:hypothetical protein